MDSKRYTDMAEILTQYLEKKKMRKTEERSMILRMKVDVLLGLQWGDEGKGKVVDVLTPNMMW
jgi:hypothetical protein